MTDRLYYPPDHTEDVLREVTSGTSTIENLATNLGVTPKTASNKAHDSVILGLINRNDYQLSITDDARRVVQLQDKSPLKEAFKELPGVSEVFEKMKEGPIEVEEIGRVVSFETGSNAAAEGTFKNYGRVYGMWIDYLNLGFYSNGQVATEEINNISDRGDPLDNPRGANSPRVPPEKVLKILSYISRADSRKNLQNISPFSESETAKILSTCYGLGLAKSTHNGPQLTERGREVQKASVGKRKQILEEALLEIPLVEAYLDRMPDGKVRNQDVVRDVSEDFLKGWSDLTIQTRAKRLYSWLLFTELAEEVERGYLKSTNTDHE